MFAIFTFRKSKDCCDLLCILLNTYIIPNVANSVKTPQHL